MSAEGHLETVTTIRKPIWEEAGRQEFRLGRENSFLMTGFGWLQVGDVLRVLVEEEVLDAPGPERTEDGIEVKGTLQESRGL